MENKALTTVSAPITPRPLYRVTEEPKSIWRGGGEKFLTRLRRIRARVCLFPFGLYLEKYRIQSFHRESKLKNLEEEGLQQWPQEEQRNFRLLFAVSLTRPPFRPCAETGSRTEESADGRDRACTTRKRRSTNGNNLVSFDVRRESIL